MLVYDMSITEPKQWKVLGTVSSVVVVDVLTCCALHHCMQCNLKVAQMNMQLIWELIFYELKLG